MSLESKVAHSVAGSVLRELCERSSACGRGGYR